MSKAHFAMWNQLAVCITTMKIWESQVGPLPPPRTFANPMLYVSIYCSKIPTLTISLNHKDFNSASTYPLLGSRCKGLSITDAARLQTLGLSSVKTDWSQEVAQNWQQLSSLELFSPVSNNSTAGR